VTTPSRNHRIQTDMEAADEIPPTSPAGRSGRRDHLRNFIDLRFERHHRDLEKRLHAIPERPRQTKVLRMSQSASSK